MNFLYDDIVHELQDTTDLCINSATDQRGYEMKMQLFKVRSKTDFLEPAQ